MFASKDLMFGQQSAGGYQISRSVRLRSSASAYLSWTPGTSATSTQKLTYSAWIKRGTLGSVQFFGLTGAISGAARDAIRFTTSNALEIFLNEASSAYLATTQLFRDPSAWYHIVVSVDTTQATSSDRIKVYVNGVQVTAFSTATYPTQNYNFTGWLVSGKAQNLGRSPEPNYYFDGYMTEINVVDGQQLAPTSFGAFDAVTGVWNPIRYSGTYGTNGFYLNFSDNSGATATTIGKDYSGNGNNWTPNNISVTAGTTYDSMVDTPTNYGSDTGAGGEVRGNYATLNPLAANSAVTAAQGNLSYTSSNDRIIKSTISVTSGKWYWEFAPGGGGSTSGCGVINPSVNIYAAVNLNIATAGVSYLGNGNKSVNGTASSYGATYTSGNIIGVALDLNSNTVTFYKDNASQGSISITSGLEWCPAFDQNTGTNYVNFGQRAFAYTAPSGYKALCTQNLPTPTISNGANYMAASLYTGTGASLTVSNAVNSISFQPDWVWIKSRSAATDNKLTDSVRGTTKALISNTTGAETTDTNGLTAFGASGFTVGTDTVYNNSGATYVGWQWKASGSTVSNTQGSITSTVSANTTAGFSIVTYTGTGVNATVGHGLGVVPGMIIAKRRSAAQNWGVTHSSLTGTQTLYLDLTQAVATGVWNGTPTSTVFNITTDGVVNTNGSTYVAYCFAPISGYSAFGSYTGNGSSDGPFVYCGFRPRYVLIKASSTGGAGLDWFIHDTSRDPYNQCDNDLEANLSLSENQYGAQLDIVSNGFKIRNSGGGTNTSGATFIYAAFAENPFTIARAR